jgi:PTH1 family peptidyl-tRNA hydrolase
MASRRIVLGIGNPGSEYEGTRHNAGFAVLDLVASRRGLAFTRLERRDASGVRLFGPKVKALIARASNRRGEPFLLVKPLSYVNLSGDVAGPLLRRAGLSPESLFVVVDDLNLPLGRIRVRPSGSAGGHGGLKSVEAALGCREYPRLRLGIGRTDAPSSKGAATGGEEGSDYVLAPFSPEEREVLGPVLECAADAVTDWLDGASVETLMGRYNGPTTGDPRDPPDGDVNLEEYL